MKATEPSDSEMDSFMQINSAGFGAYAFLAYQNEGKGVIVVNTTLEDWSSRPGHSTVFVAETKLRGHKQWEGGEFKPMLERYDPETEVIFVFAGKTWNKAFCMRFCNSSPKELLEGGLASGVIQQMFVH